MRYAPFTSQEERQHIIGALPPDERIIGEENIDLNENGIPQTNRLIIESMAFSGNAEEAGDMREALLLLGVKPEEGEAV